MRAKADGPKRFHRADFPLYSAPLRLRALADNVDSCADMVNEWDRLYYSPGNAVPLDKRNLVSSLLLRGEQLRDLADSGASSEKQDEEFEYTRQLMLQFIQGLRKCYSKP